MAQPTITIGLTASSGFFPDAVRWLTKSKVSHARLQYSDPVWGGDWVMQATWPQIQIVPKETAGDATAAEFECLFDAASAMRTLREYIGRDYNLEGIAALAWVYGTWRLFKRRAAMPKYSTGEQFCSELVARMLVAAKLPGTESWNVEAVTPEDLLEYCTAHPELFKAVKI